MMDTHSSKHTTPEHEHGTVRSYVRGFLLSLLFTFVPYYLVVEKEVSGNALLATILVFAVLQMLVQIIFFLHLGREKGPRWQLLFFIATVGIILVVVGASLWIMRHLHYNMTPVTSADVSKKLVEKEGIHQIGGEETGACQGRQANHKITIKHSRVSPLLTTAQVCDSLTFINQDDEVREVTFAAYPDHGVYAGESEVRLRKGRATTIILTDPGTYHFHDYLHSETAGKFTVMPRTAQ